MTRRVPNGYVTVVDGYSVLIRRHEFSTRDRREFGLPKVMFEPEIGDVQTTLKGAIAEARDVVRSEPYELIVGTRTNPSLPGLRVNVPFEEGVRLIESLETIDDGLTFELKALGPAQAAA